jgi:hypothetical protein
MDHENNAAKRSDNTTDILDAQPPLHTCLNDNGIDPLSESTRTPIALTYRLNTSYSCRAEQTLKSPLKKSSPTKTCSPTFGVDALWETDGLVRARYADVPSVVFVEGSFEKDVQSDDDDLAMMRNPLGCSRGNGICASHCSHFVSRGGCSWSAQFPSRG